MYITAEFAQQLINYLATKPYAEVYQFISELSKGVQKEKAGVKEEEKK